MPIYDNLNLIPDANELLNELKIILGSDGVNLIVPE